MAHAGLNPFLRRGLASLMPLLLLAFGAPGICRPSHPFAKTPASSAEELEGTIRKLLPLHRPMGTPRAGEWLAIHPESGQTFRDYLGCDPTLPQGSRRVLYVRPIGAFNPAQSRILALTTEFLGLYFSLPVRVLPALDAKTIPAKARRIHPLTGQPQLLTTYILNDVLKPNLPSDAAACLALTASDLWPREGWNFVFGQASLADRVGVWSMNRNGDPSLDTITFQRCLLRTLKTASHETGHMFSLRHCTKFECNMSGSETLEEGDGFPLALCPECLAKVCWATHTPPLTHLQKLERFCHAHGLDVEAAYYLNAIQLLQTPGTLRAAGK